MEELITAAWNGCFPWQESERYTFIKQAILAMQGSWLTQHKYVYHITDSTHAEDLDKKLFSFRVLKDGTTRFASRSEILTNRTMYLIGLQALNLEHTPLGTAAYQTKTLPAQNQGCNCRLFTVENVRHWKTKIQPEHTSAHFVGKQAIQL